VIGKGLARLLFGSSLVIFSALGDDAIRDLYERLYELEKRVERQTPGGDNVASEEDLERLRSQVRELRGEVEELKHKLTSVVGSAVESSPSRKPALPEDTKSRESSKDEEDFEDEGLDSVLKNLEDPHQDETKGGKKKKTTQEIRNPETLTIQKSRPASGVMEMGGATAQYNQALKFYTAKEYAEAEEAFRYHITQFKSGKHVPQARLKIAQCQLALAKEHKDPKRAKEASKGFAALFKSNPKSSVAPECLLEMARALEVEGKKKQATIVLRKLQADFSNNKEICAKAEELLKQYGKKSA
jgi:TolA-binding protein